MIAVKNATGAIRRGRLLEFSGGFTISEDSDGNPSISVSTGAPNQTVESAFSIVATSTGGSRQLRLIDKASETKYNWLVGAQHNVDNGLEFTPSTAIGGTTFSSPVMVLLRTGNVGIGLTDPAALLHVAGASDAFQIIWADSDNSGAAMPYLLFGYSGSVTAPTRSWAVGANTSGTLVFTTRTGAWAAPNDTSALELNTSGDLKVVRGLGVGVAAPTTQGHARATRWMVDAGAWMTGPGSDMIDWYVGSTLRMRLENGQYLYVYQGVRTDHVTVWNAGRSAAVGYFGPYRQWLGSGSDETPTIAGESGLGVYFCTNGSSTVVGSLSPAGVLHMTGAIRTSYWFQNVDSGEGLYNEAVPNYFYADSTSYWNIASTSGSFGGLRLRDGLAGTVKGYLYWDINGFGLLGGSGEWGVQVIGASTSGRLFGRWGVNTAPHATSALAVGGASELMGETNVYIAANTMSGTGHKGLAVYQATAANDAMLTFHISGHYAGYFGLGAAENDLVWGGWSVGSSTRHRILHTGNYGMTGGPDLRYILKAGDNDVTGTFTFSGYIIARNASGSAGNYDMIEIRRNAATIASLGSESSGDHFVIRRGSDGAVALTINRTNGNVTAGTFVGALSGNATTASSAATLSANLSYSLLPTGNGSWDTGSGTTLTITRALSVGGNVTGANFTLGSDRRLKTDIRDLYTPMERLLLVRPVYYRLQNAPERVRAGVVAQEVQEVFPECVFEGADGMLAVDYDQLIPHIIAALKELAWRMTS